mmetsp:Transcript_44984/g.97892  ORF Transcript_44984/g.97892 Transcript_44984/m.97892 type:complete len:248 (+) Transcript_44984:1250-1993(+)
MRKQVHIVAGWNCYGHLKFARQVRKAIQRLFFHRSGSHDLDFLSHLITLHQKNLVVSTRARQAVVMDVIGVVQNLRVEFFAANIWAGCAQHISANISTCGDSIHASLVHCSHSVLDISLQNSMDLPSLTRGDLQGSICKVLANVVHGNPLFRSAVSTRQADTNHEAEGILNTHLLALFSQVSVILLVAAMGLDQLGVLERDLASGDVVQAFLHASSKLLRLDLDLLVSFHWAIITTSSCISLVDTKS